jgi:phage-related protein
MLLAFKVVFGIAIIRRIISVGKAVTNMAKAIVTSQVAITVFTGLFQKMTKRMKGGLLGIAAAAAALVGFDEEVRKFITDVADAIQINDMLAGVFDNLGLSTEALEANFKDLENELEGTNTNFLQNTGSILDFIPSVEGAGGAISDTSVSAGKLADALDSMKKKIFPVESALSDLKDEKAALQKMVASGIITFEDMETTLNSLAREALGLDTTLGDLKDRQDVAEKAFAAGIITGEEYKNIIAGIKSETIDYNAENEKTFGAGAIKGVKDYYQAISNNAANMSDFVTDAFGSLETTLSDFFYTGKLDFGTFTDAIKRGLADLAAKAVITTGLNFLGDVFPSLKFADGGLVPGSGGPRSDDVLARVSSGEYVIKAASVSKFGAGFFDQLNSGQMPMGGGGGGGVSIDAGIMDGLTPGFFLGGLIRGIGNIIGGIVDAITSVIKSVVDIVKDIVGAVTDAVKGLVEGIMSGDLATLIGVASMFILPGVGGAIASNLASGTGFINAVTTGIAESFAAGVLGGGSLTSIATSVGVEAAKGILTDGLSGALSDKFLDITGGMGRSKGSYAQGRADSFGTLYNQSAPYLAAMTGANVHGGDNVRVGERGPEMFIPGRDGTIAPIKAGGSELVSAVNDMKEEIITLRRQMSRMMSSGSLAGARS